MSHAEIQILRLWNRIFQPSTQVREVYGNNRSRHVKDNKNILKSDTGPKGEHHEDDPHTPAVIIASR